MDHWTMEKKRDNGKLNGEGGEAYPFSGAIHFLMAAIATN